MRTIVEWLFWVWAWVAGGCLVLGSVLGLLLLIRAAGRHE